MASKFNIDQVLDSNPFVLGSSAAMQQQQVKKASRQINNPAAAAATAAPPSEDPMNSANFRMPAGRDMRQPTMAQPVPREGGLISSPGEVVTTPVEGSTRPAPRPADGPPGHVSSWPGQPATLPPGWPNSPNYPARPTPPISMQPTPTTTTVTPPSPSRPSRPASPRPGAGQDTRPGMPRTSMDRYGAGASRLLSSRKGM